VKIDTKKKKICLLGETVVLIVVERVLRDDQGAALVVAAILRVGEGVRLDGEEVLRVVVDRGTLVVIVAVVAVVALEEVRSVDEVVEGTEVEDEIAIGSVLEVARDGADLELVTTTALTVVGRLVVGFEARVGGVAASTNSSSSV
jgi:hypothetical protein